MPRHYFKPDSILVSVLLLHKQGDGHVKDLLANILPNTYPHIEVVVVNLGHSEEEVNQLYELFPSIIQINLSKNTEREFALGEGVKLAKGDYVLFLNAIREINAECIEKLVQAAKKSSRIAIVVPQVRDFANKVICLYKRSDTPTNLGGYLDYTAYHAQEITGEELACYAQFPCNDAFLISVDFLHKLEENEKGSFFWLDELDMAETVHENRYKIFYEPGAVAYLDYEEERSWESHKVYIKTRNRLASIRKHSHGWVLLGMLLLFSVSYIPKHTFQHLLHMRFDHVFAFYRGVVWNMFHSVKSGGLFSHFKWR